MTINNQLQDLIKNNLFTLFEIDKMSEAEQEETIARIGKIIFDAVLIRVLPMLKDEELKEYDKLLDTNPEPEGVLDFFFEKIPNFLAIMVEESEKFRQESEAELAK